MVPGYAQRTGSRLFFQPAVFQKGIEAAFSATARSSDVYFPFAWSEEDDVSIELPAGFELEQPQRPAAIEAGAVRWDLLIGTEDAQKRLVVRRAFAMGLTNTILFLQKTEAGSLERMPEAPHDQHRIERTLEGTIDTAGALVASVRDVSYGAQATDARTEFRRLELANYRHSIERRLVAAVPGGRIARLVPDRRHE